MQPHVTRTHLEGSNAFTLFAGELTATIVPSVGMVVASITRRGTELLGQRGGLTAYRERGSSFGIPLLYPWANRLGGLDYVVDSTRVTLDPATSPIRLDSNGLPIHGLLTASPLWQVEHLEADEVGAEVVATLAFDEHPELLCGFPFPHALALTHRLDAGGLQTSLTVMPTADTPVPVSFGFHPYLAAGGDRSTWTVDLPVVTRALLDAVGLPSGEVGPAELGPRELGSTAFDDFYPAIETDPIFTVSSSACTLEIAFDAAYPHAQVYSPVAADFICFEPMTAPINALRSGDGLRFVAPGDVLTATFRIDVTGS